MASPFFEVDIVGAEYLTTTIGRFVTELPKMTIGMAKDAAPEVMSVAVMPKVRLNTPVKTGSLRANTDWEIVEDDPELHIQVFSTAENIRTGYPYAKARAFGFNTQGLGGYFWQPPEDPVYPEQAMEEAKPMLDIAIRGAAYQRVVTVIGG